MKKDYPNKSITNEDIEETPHLIEYNFPEHNLTIKAKSLEEAQEKLQKLISQ